MSIRSSIAADLERECTAHEHFSYTRALLAEAAQALRSQPTVTDEMVDAAIAARLEHAVRCVDPEVCVDDHGPHETWHGCNFNAMKAAITAALTTVTDSAAVKFCREIFAVVNEGDDFDGGTLQDMGVKYGLLIPTEMAEPCGPEGACNCAEYGDFPQTCYRFTAALTGEPA
jgi:hypothetical protein